MDPWFDNNLLVSHSCKILTCSIIKCVSQLLNLTDRAVESPETQRLGQTRLPFLLKGICWSSGAACWWPVTAEFLQGLQYFFRKFWLFLCKKWKEEHKCCCSISPGAVWVSAHGRWERNVPSAPKNQSLGRCRKHIMCLNEVPKFGRKSQVTVTEEYFITSKAGVKASPNSQCKKLTFIWKTLWENRPTSLWFYLSSCIFSHLVYEQPWQQRLLLPTFMAPGAVIWT